jgi:hypothetical protein
LSGKLYIYKVFLEFFSITNILIIFSEKKKLALLEKARLKLSKRFKGFVGEK